MSTKMEAFAAKYRTTTVLAVDLEASRHMIVFILCTFTLHVQRGGITTKYSVLLILNVRILIVERTLFAIVGKISQEH